MSFESKYSSRPLEWQVHIQPRKGPWGGREKHCLFYLIQLRSSLCPVTCTMIRLFPDCTCPCFQGATVSDSLRSTVLPYETPLALAHTCCHGQHGFLDTDLFTKAEGIRKGRENTKIWKWILFNQDFACPGTYISIDAFYFKKWFVWLPVLDTVLSLHVGAPWQLERCSKYSVPPLYIYPAHGKRATSRGLLWPMKGKYKSHSRAQVAKLFQVPTPRCPLLPSRSWLEQVRLFH